MFMYTNNNWNGWNPESERERETEKMEEKIQLQMKTWYFGTTNEWYSFQSIILPSHTETQRMNSIISVQVDRKKTDT